MSGVEAHWTATWPPEPDFHGCPQSDLGIPLTPDSFRALEERISNHLRWNLPIMTPDERVAELARGLTWLVLGIPQNTEVDWQ